MVYTPHTLQRERDVYPGYDQYGNPIDLQPVWVTLGKCRCDDNTTLDQIDKAGEMYVYKYHIVYEGEGIKADDKVRALDAEGKVRGEGIVVRSASSNFFSKSQIWI